MEILSESFRDAFELLDINKEYFDFFDIIPPKEVLVSKWIEFILNYKINGVGNLPMEKLLELTNKDIDIDEYEFQSIDTEVTTDNLKRIDILVKYNGLWIVIENKIDSFENGSQTNEYYNYIERIRGNNEVVYIYLKPNYNGSIPVNNAFQIVTYDRFINKLKEISEFEYNDKDKYKYLREFILSGGRFMNSEEMEITESLKFYIKHIDEFEKITNEYKDKNKQVKIMIAEHIISKLNEVEPVYEYSRNTNTFIQFYKSNWKNERHTGAHFEILFNDSNIVGRVINADVVLHLEGSLNSKDMERFATYGITRKSTLAYINDEAIDIKVNMNFTSSDGINKAIDEVTNILLSYIEKYETIIDQSVYSE